MILAEQLANFADKGNQQKFTLADGQVLQGWIMEITEDGLVISTKEGERGVDVHVRLSDINLASLTYWDSRLQLLDHFTRANGRPFFQFLPPYNCINLNT